MSSSTEILFNSPALNSLKRSQLIKLCKRHGLKAAGKNAEMVERLQEYGRTMQVHEPFVIPTSDAAIDEAEVLGHDEDSEDGGSDIGQTPRGPGSFRTSEPWSIIDEGSREEENVLPLLSRNRSVKSTFSTSTMGEFGSQGSGTSSKSSSVTSSLKALASSLGLSRQLSFKSIKSSKSSSKKVTASQSQPSLVEPVVEIQPQPEPEPEPEPEEQLTAPVPEPHTYCPDPALASSTIRLVSSTSQLDLLQGTTSSLVVTKFDDPMGDGAESDSSDSFNPPDPRRGSIYPDLPEFALKTAIGSSSSIFPGSFPSFSSPSPKNSSPPAPSPPAEPIPAMEVDPAPAPAVSTVTASILEEMNRRMNIQAGSTAAITTAVLDRKPIAPATSVFADLLGSGKGDGRFGDTHKAAFDQMDSIVNHYAARRPAQKKSTLGGATPKRVRPSFAPGPSSAKRRSRASIAAKRTSLVGAAGKKPATDKQEETNEVPTAGVEEVKDGRGKGVLFDLVDTSSVAGDEKSVSSIAATTVVVVAKPSEAAKKKMDQIKSQPRTRSSAGRKSTGRSSIVGTKAAKSKTGGLTSKFAFLKSSAKLVRSVWGAATGSGSKTTSTAPAPKASVPPAPKPAPAPVAKTRTSNTTSTIKEKGRIFSGGLTSTSLSQRTSQVKKPVIVAPAKEEKKMAKKGGVFSKPVNSGTFAKPGSGAVSNDNGAVKSPGSETSKLPGMTATGSVGVRRAVSSIGMGGKAVQRSVTTTGSFGGVKKQPFGFGNGNGKPPLPIGKTTSASGSLKRAVSSVSGLNTTALKPKRGSTLTAPTAASLARRNNSIASTAHNRPPLPSSFQSQTGVKSPKVFSPTTNASLKSPVVTTSSSNGVRSSPVKTPLESVENVVDIKPAESDQDTAMGSKKGSCDGDQQSLDKLIDQTAAEFADDAMMDFGLKASSSASSSLSSRSICSTGTSGSGSSMRSVSGRRPRISRSKVIAKLDKKRAEAEEVQHVLGALGGHAVGKGAAGVRRSAVIAAVGGTPGRRRDVKETKVLMSAKKALRRSEIARRRTASKSIEWGGIGREGDQMDIEA
ncbi:hypothetical protein FRC02_005274 [Tulasnella sp. 418]|nr:hypothetical protein FRC02_005274 [Tulasnella sp. 418]